MVANPNYLISGGRSLKVNKPQVPTLESQIRQNAGTIGAAASQYMPGMWERLIAATTQENPALAQQRRLLETDANRFATEQSAAYQQEMMRRGLGTSSMLGSGLAALRTGIQDKYARQRSEMDQADYDRRMSLAANLLQLLQSSGLSASELLMQLRGQKLSEKAAQANATGGMLSGLGSIAGAIIGGPVGAAIGGSIGKTSYSGYPSNGNIG